LHACQRQGRELKKPEIAPLLSSRSVQELDPCYIARGGGGQKVAYLLPKGTRQRSATKMLARDEARRVAANIAKLPSY
jgi:hypothetical protein